MADASGACAVCGDPKDHGGRPHTSAFSRRTQSRGSRPLLLGEPAVTGWIRGQAYCGGGPVVHDPHHYDWADETTDGSRPAESWVWCPGAPEVLSVVEVEEFLDG